MYTSSASYLKHLSQWAWHREWPMYTRSASYLKHLSQWAWHREWSMYTRSASYLKHLSQWAWHREWPMYTRSASYLKHLSQWAWHREWPMHTRSASYLKLHIKTDSEGRFRAKHWDKRQDFNFPIVNFPSICSNIPEALAYVVYLSDYTILQWLLFLSWLPCC
jgi:hypothetical protein